MKSKFTVILLVFCIVISFSGCNWFHNHKWSTESDRNKIICTKCKRTFCDVNGHNFTQATCSNKSYCTICFVNGTKESHTYSNHRCTSCGKIEIDAIDTNKFGFIDNYGMQLWLKTFSVANSPIASLFNEIDIHYTHFNENNTLYFMAISNSNIVEGGLSLDDTEAIKENLKIENLNDVKTFNSTKFTNSEITYNGTTITIKDVIKNNGIIEIHTEELVDGIRYDYTYIPVDMIKISTLHNTLAKHPITYSVEIK